MKTHGLLPAKGMSFAEMFKTNTMCGVNRGPATNYTPNITCGNCKRTKRFAEYQKIWEDSNARSR